jgi:hypothetical protein
MKIVITESQLNFLKRRWEMYEPLVKREMRDQEPCWFKKRYEVKGFQRYYETVRDSVAEFIFYDYFGDRISDITEEEEVRFMEMLHNEMNTHVKDMVKDYYESYDCNDYPNIN